MNLKPRRIYSTIVPICEIIIISDFFFAETTYNYLPVNIPQKLGSLVQPFSSRNTFIFYFHEASLILMYIHCTD